MKVCSACRSKPPRSPYQRYCKQCHALAMKRMRWRRVKAVKELRAALIPLINSVYSYPPGEERLDKVRAAWRELTGEVL